MRVWHERFYHRLVGCTELETATNAWHRWGRRPSPARVEPRRLILIISIEPVYPQVHFAVEGER